MVGTQPEAEIQDGALDLFLSFTLAGSGQNGPLTPR